MDYRNPDYPTILNKRIEKLEIIRADPELLQACKVHYRTHPWDFIRDWGMTFEPRNIELQLPASIPFIPFPRQTELLEWLFARWQGSERGLVEKSRDFGATWLAVGFAVCMWNFYPGFTAGFGSRKEALVDKKGDPKCIFEKVRFFIRALPKEFRPEGYEERIHAGFLKIVNPENGATITGEAGDDIGRGARMSIYFVDEAAFINNQKASDAALSQTTNCQIDISTPNGNGNEFYRKRHKGTIPVFVMDWRDDPRKDQTWYDKQVQEQDEVTVAQEIDRDYNASVENIFIPAKWVEASVDAHLKLGFDPEGVKTVSFDPADTGDAKALAHRHGSVILDADQKTQGDITDAIPWVREFIAARRVDQFVYDADGMGAPSIKLSVQNEFQANGLTTVAFRGSGEVKKPEVKHKKLDRLHKDAFANRRAQAAYELRERFENTFNAIARGIYSDPEKMISLSSEITCLQDLKAELSRPQRLYTNNGKILLEPKQTMKKRGVASPNLFDAVMMSFEYVPPSSLGEFRMPQPKKTYDRNSRMGRR